MTPDHLAALRKIADLLDQSGGDRFAIEARGIARAALGAALAAAPPAGSADVGRCPFTFGRTDGTKCQAQRGHWIHGGLDDGLDFAHEFQP